MKSLHIGIEAQDRVQIVDGLSRLLADSYTLYLKTHNFHWNVTGPMFNSLHIMFEGQYTELALAVDEIAERIRSLGARAPGSYRAFAALTSIDEGEGEPDALEMVRQLAASHEAVIRTARALLPVAGAADDAVTEDLTTRRLEVHEKTAWMLRSLLE